jgi:hypothetical protein
MLCMATKGNFLTASTEKAKQRCSLQHSSSDFFLLLNNLFEDAISISVSQTVRSQVVKKLVNNELRRFSS